MTKELDENHERHTIIREIRALKRCRLMEML